MKVNRVASENEADSNPTITSLKWILVSLSVLNILNTIWVGIYMEKAIENYKNNWMYEQTELRNYTNDDMERSNQIYRGLIIAFLVIMNLVNLMGIYACIKVNYLLVQIYAVLLMIQSLSCIGSYYMKGTVTGWLIPFIISVLAFIYCHFIRIYIMIPSIQYSNPNSNL